MQSFIIRRFFRLLPILLGVFLVYACGSGEGEQAENGFGVRELPEVVDFNFHIKPILSDRCFACHGPDENTMEAGLRFDTQEGIFAALGENKDRFAVVAGKPDSSEVMHRLTTDDPSLIMPPPESNLTISDYEKELLRKWIEQGAVYKKHWAFIPPEKAKLPTVKNSDWPINAIDNFILKRLEDEGLQPAGEATKEELIRRVTFDITGLPPTLAEIDDFLADSSPSSFEKVVDRLLATTHYGERMATVWLDAARYSDTNGYQDDLEREIWPWRDWVISAYNRNLPFDEFTRWQLAGDLLPNATLEQVLATGFNRNHKVTQEGGVIPEEYRVEYVADRTHTTGTVFMGLTMECARCHDHKYDPISQKDYFSMFAFFNSVPEQGLIDYGDKVPKPRLELNWNQVEKDLTFITHRDSTDALRTMVMDELPEMRATFVLNRGQYDAPGEKVLPNTLEVLEPLPEGLPPNRLGLAEWLLDDSNPLTARVTVNRYWQMLFGRGIVSTSDDFGNQGALPSHPELLDWLAVEFREQGWDIKKMLRLILTSATYRQSSNASEKLMALDPENVLLARGPRYRLTAEMIRDNALALSGLMVYKVGGPSVKPYQPDGLWKETTAGGGYKVYIQDKGESLYRKSMYTYWKRTVPPPSMMTFDAATRDLCTVKRQATSTPLQALVLMNDPQLVEASRFIAYRIIEEGGETTTERLNYAFRLITSRSPSEEESGILQELLDEKLSIFQTTPEKADELLSVGDSPHNTTFEKVETAAFAVVANALLNLYETITKR